MIRYVALVDGEDGAFGVSFPDCPGCTVMKTTIEEAVREAADALAEWMSDRIAAGLPLPQARSAEAIRNDPDWTEDVATGMLATIPLVLDEGRRVEAQLSLDAGLLARVDEAAHRRGISRSEFLAAAAREKLLAAG